MLKKLLSIDLSKYLMYAAIISVVTLVTTLVVKLNSRENTIVELNTKINKMEKDLTASNLKIMTKITDLNVKASKELYDADVNVTGTVDDVLRYINDDYNYTSLSNNNNNNNNTNEPSNVQRVVEIRPREQVTIDKDIVGKTYYNNRQSSKRINAIWSVYNKLGKRN